MGSRHTAENREVKKAEKARIGDASCEIWFEGRTYVYLMVIVSKITKRKPKTKWRYDWEVLEEKKRFDENVKPKLIAYSSANTFQRAFTKAGRVVARKLGL